MLAYALRRILQVVPTILAISLIMFFLLNVLPGNAALILASDKAQNITSQVFGVRGKEIFLFSQPRIVRSMHEDAIGALETGNPALAQDVVSRDNDVDRLHWLVARQFNLVLIDPNLSRNMNLTLSRAASYYVMSRIVERIGDHAVRIAENVPVLLSVKVEKGLLSDLKEASGMGLDLLQKSTSAFFDDDMDAAHAHLDAVAALEERCTGITHRASPLKGEAVLMGVLPLAATAFYTSTSNFPWNNTGMLGGAAGGHAEDGGSMDEVVAQLEERLQANPGDLEGWRMLGRSYLVSNRFPQAVSAYEKASALTGGKNPEIELDLAEALVLTEPPAAQAKAKDIIDAALAANESNQKALWYSGVMAMRAGDNETAKARFTKLLESDPPQQIREILVAQLEKLGAPVPEAATPSPKSVR